MAINKVFPSRSFNAGGAAFTQIAYSSGFVVDRDGRVDRVASTGIVTRLDKADNSWSTPTTGVTVNTTGTMIFSNLTAGGDLGSVTIANRGANTLVVGFNSNSVLSSSGFPLASGESMQHNGVITSIWAASSTGTTVVNAIGLPNYNRFNFA